MDQIWDNTHRGWLDSRILRQSASVCTFPANGDYVCITLRRDVQGWEGSRLVTSPEGTSYEGIAVDADRDGFFALNCTDGQYRQFYLNDSALNIQVSARVRHT
jgi:hypothetical protein